MDAFDADVLIFATHDDHPHGAAVRDLIARTQRTRGLAGVGSTLLAFETLIKPVRSGDDEALAEHIEVLDQLELFPADLATVELAIDLGARYRLKTVDAIHLATAVSAGADRFITNNKKDFSKAIDEIDITYPEDLVAPSA